MVISEPVRVNLKGKMGEAKSLIKAGTRKGIKEEGILLGETKKEKHDARSDDNSKNEAENVVRLEYVQCDRSSCLSCLTGAPKNTVGN